MKKFIEQHDGIPFHSTSWNRCESLPAIRDLQAERDHLIARLSLLTGPALIEASQKISRLRRLIWDEEDVRSRL